MTTDEYRDRVNTIAWNRSGNSIYNGTLSQAVAVVEALLTNARKDLMILTRDLNTRIFGRDDIVMHAKLFLASDAGNRLRIMMEVDKPQNRRLHPLLQGLAEYEGFSLRHVPDDLQSSYGFHFVAADDDCYNFGRDKSKPFAIATFGDKESASGLTKFFDEAWDRCTELTTQ